MKFPKPISVNFSILFFLFFGFIAPHFGKFQAQTIQTTAICPFDHRRVPDGLKIRAIKVSGRRGNDSIEKKLTLKFGGQGYARDLLYQAQKEVEDALSEEVNQSFEKQTGIIGGAAPAVIFTKPCVEIDTTAKTIDFIINIFFLGVNLKELAKNILPVPRSVKPSFYNKMSPVLRSFTPKFDLSFDRKTGAEGSLDLSTNLLQFSDLWQAKELSDSKYRLDLNFSGRKSFSERYFQSKSDLTFSKIQPDKLVEKLDFGLSFIANDQPLNEMRHFDIGLEVGGKIKLRPRFGALNTLYFEGNYSNSTHKVFDNSGQNILANKENKFKFRSFIDGILWRGFSRIGVWAESAKITNTSEKYHRLAAIFAFQKEFGKGTQTFGLETVTGGGKVWGKVPQYARFFGGNNSANFLYESPDSLTMTGFPVGPLLRSYGKTKANAPTFPGAKSYWHTNLNLSIPIPFWSKRLIPDETITYSDGSTKKLNEVLETFTINSAIGGIGGDLLDSIVQDLMKKNPNLTEDEAEQQAVPIAQKQAEKIVNKEIAPTIKFISRHANLFAVKPLIMTDAAKIYDDFQPKGFYRFGAGGGFKVITVTAGAEFGYLWSFPRKINEPKGNFVFRITFQNLF